MLCIHPVKSPAYHVIAAFTDGVLSFDLSHGETFADFAARLDQLGQRHTGMLTAIYLKPARSGRLNPAFQPGN